MLEPSIVVPRPYAVLSLFVSCQPVCPVSRVPRPVCRFSSSTINQLSTQLTKVTASAEVPIFPRILRIFAYLSYNPYL